MWLICFGHSIVFGHSGSRKFELSLMKQLQGFCNLGSLVVHRRWFIEGGSLVVLLYYKAAYGTLCRPPQNYPCKDCSIEYVVYIASIVSNVYTLVPVPVSQKLKCLAPRRSSSSWRRLPSSCKSSFPINEQL